MRKLCHLSSVIQMVSMKNSNKAWGALFALAVLVGHKLTLDNNDQIITSKYAWLKNAGQNRFDQDCHL